MSLVSLLQPIPFDKESESDIIHNDYKTTYQQYLNENNNMIERVMVK